MKRTETEKELPLLLKIQPFMDSLLEIKKEKRNLLEIIYWWEIKRIPYNLFIVTLGWLSINSSHYFLKLSADEHVYNFNFLLTTVILFNLAYSLSCVSEIFTKKTITYAPSLFKKGLLFCTLIYILPVILHFSTWLFDLS